MDSAKKKTTATRETTAVRKPKANKTAPNEEFNEKSKRNDFKQLILETIIILLLLFIFRISRGETGSKRTVDK
jgi:hypothetical protein